MKVLFCDATTKTLYVVHTDELKLEPGDTTTIAERNEEFVVMDVVDLRDAGIELHFEGAPPEINEHDYDALVTVQPFWSAVGAG